MGEKRGKKQVEGKYGSTNSSEETRPLYPFTHKGEDES